AVLLQQDFEFEGAQFAIGDDEEVAAAAGEVEKFETREARAEVGEAGLAARRAVGADGFKLSTKIIEEERLDDLEDVALGCVMRAELAADIHFRVVVFNDLLKKRAED